MLGSGEIPSSRAAETPAADLPAPEPLLPADLAFDVGLEMKLDAKGSAAAFAFAEKEFARNPRPNVQAHYAEFLVEGKLWGAPEGQAARGLALAREALTQGSLYARRVVGWELVMGRHGPANRPLGLAYLQQAAAAGVPEAMISLSEVYAAGIGVGVDLKAAEVWALRAAWLGKTSGLVRLARRYERLAPPDLARAGALYFEAASRGDVEALERIDRWVEAKKPAGRRAHSLYIIFYASHGVEYPTSTVRTAVQLLETEYPNDPQALCYLGRAYSTHDSGIWNLEKAYAYLDRASQLGSDDARADQARLLADGAGVKKDPARAVAELQELAAKGNACACAHLGFYYYWGSLGPEVLPKNPAKALEFSRRAADGGDALGQDLTASCYESGVGTPVDYALAARYHQMMAKRGSRHARTQLSKLLKFIPH